MYANFLFTSWLSNDLITSSISRFVEFISLKKIFAKFQGQFEANLYCLFELWPH